MKIQAEAVQFTIDAELLSMTEQKVSELESFFNRIINNFKSK